MTTPEMSERDKLRNELFEIWEKNTIDFILADRARIVEPLIKAGLTPCQTRMQQLGILVNAVDESLRRAGRKELK